jgi:hypothetical protein
MDVLCLGGKPNCSSHNCLRSITYFTYLVNKILKNNLPIESKILMGRLDGTVPDISKFKKVNYLVSFHSVRI